MENNLYVGTDIGGTTFTSGLFDYYGKLIYKTNKKLISDFTSKKRDM